MPRLLTLRGLGSLSEVVRAKAETLMACHQVARAIINADDRFAAYWAARKPSRRLRLIEQWRSSRCEVSTSEDGQLIELRLPDESIEIQLDF